MKTNIQKKTWQELGSVIYSRVVFETQNRNLPEYEEWLKRAARKFPDSIFILIDAECFSFLYHKQQGNCEECIRHGERYLQAMVDYHRGKLDQTALIFQPLAMAGVYCEQTIKIQLADACQQAG